MPFRLFYRGTLRSNGDKDEKHRIRLALHPQLVKLWEQEPLLHNRKYLTKAANSNNLDVVYSVGSHDFPCVVSEKLKTYAEIDILFLRPQPPGQIITTGGDIDNRLKTLFDALRRPLTEAELPREELLQKTPNPCHCLLSDDSLISRVSVTTDTLLDASGYNEVVLVITTTVWKTGVICGNISYIE